MESTQLSDKPSQHKGFHLVRLNFSDDKLPEFKEIKSKDIVWFGKDNDYPTKLLEYFNRSAFHNAIINGKANFISGAGIEYNPQLPPNEKAIVEQYIKAPNKFMTLEELIYRDAMSLVISGSIPHQIAWNNSKKGFKVYPVPFEHVRMNKEMTKFYVKPEWKKGQTNDVGTPYSAFNPLTAKSAESQIHYFKMFRQGAVTYALPEYIGAIQWLGIDTEIANFHYNNLKNGFAAGTMVEIMVGTGLDDQSKDIIERKFKQKTGGSDRGGEILLNFIEDQNQKSNVIPMRPNDLDKQFEQLYQQAMKAIFTGHGVTSPVLFGIATEGALGQRQEMLDAYELFFATYVEMRQRILENLHNSYLKQMGVSDPQLKIKKSQPISMDAIMLFEKGLLSKEAAAARLGISKEELPVAVQAPAAQPVKFSAIPKDYEAPEDADKWKDEDHEIFAQFGENESDFETIGQLEHDWFTESEGVGFQFANLDDMEAKILDLIAKNPKLNITDIADAENMTVDEIGQIVSKLAERKLLKTGDGGSMVITPRGNIEIQDFGKEFRNIYVKYKYNGPKDDRNRPFCAEMLKMGKVYSRAEIDKLSLLLGYNVWKRRGGWMTVAGSEPALHLPYCRHTWSQVVLRKRIN